MKYTKNNNYELATTKARKLWEGYDRSRPEETRHVNEEDPGILECASHMRKY